MINLSFTEKKNNSKKDKIVNKIEKKFKEIVDNEFSQIQNANLTKTSATNQFQKAVQILYERLDLLSSEELIFYYKFIVNKAKKLYFDFLQQRGIIIN